MLYGIAVFFACQAKQGTALTRVLLETQVSGETAQALYETEMEQENPVGLCFWGEQPSQQVRCLLNGSSAQVTRIFLAGNPELARAGGLAWQQGCLLDEGTAQTLFGTAQCAGQRLQWEGQEYPVLDTFRASRPTMLMMAGPEDLTNRLLLALPADQGITQAPQCLTRWGLWGSVLDVYAVWALTSNLLLLAPGGILLRLCLGLGRRRRWLGWAAGALCAALLSRWVVIPPGMIPSQWSDFSFWGTWLAEQQKNLVGLWFHGQLQMTADMVKSMAAAAAAFLLVLGPREVTNANFTD